jgi:hypothetical protein
VTTDGAIINSIARKSLYQRGLDEVDINNDGKPINILYRRINEEPTTIMSPSTGMPARIMDGTGGSTQILSVDLESCKMSEIFDDYGLANLFKYEGQVYIKNVSVDSPHKTIEFYRMDGVNGISETNSICEFQKPIHKK